MLQVPAQSEMFITASPTLKVAVLSEDATPHRDFLGGKVTPRDHHLDPDPCGGNTPTSFEGS